MSKKKKQASKRKPPKASEGMFFTTGYKPEVVSPKVAKTNVGFKRINIKMVGETPTYLCHHCREHYLFDEMVKENRTKLGIRWLCKKCANIQQKVHRDNNPERVSESNRKYREKVKKLKQIAAEDPK